MSDKRWITKNGHRILYKDLEDDHLLNILKWIEKKSKDGFTLLTGGGCFPDEMWYDEIYLEGREVKKHFDYYNLKKEALKRGLILKEININVNL